MLFIHCSKLILCLDDSWVLLALQDRGLTANTDLTEVANMIGDEASVLHPIHMRRMDLFSTRQTGMVIDLARDLNTTN